MSAVDFGIKFVVAVFATWRVTHLLSSEDGPFDLFANLRLRLGNGLWGQLLDCFYCLSLWIAAPGAFWICRQPADLLFTWLALSGAACLLERLGREPIFVQPISEAKKGM